MKALILVDIQNDFMPGGALPVPDGDAVVPVANGVQAHFDLVVATQDWHPPDHGSFVTQHPGHQPGDVIQLAGLDQVLWPPHCVQGTKGAELHPNLDTRRVPRVFRKGTHRDVDSYSGFFDNARRHATGLGDHLREQGVEAVYLLGLATDYCVRYTALDALDLGFETVLIHDGTRAVVPAAHPRTLEELRSAGVRLITSAELTRA